MITMQAHGTFEDKSIEIFSKLNKDNTFLIGTNTRQQMYITKHKGDLEIYSIIKKW